MKEIAIFYRDKNNQPAINYIRDNIYNVLGDYVNITNYYLDEMSAGEKIGADAYLVCYEEMLAYLVNHVDDFSKVIVMTRSIQKKHLESIIDIPKGTDVLVINDSNASTLQTVYMIYELGIGHLNLLPFDETMLEKGAYEHVHEAIIARYSEHAVPPHIKKIHNICNREVSFETFQKLMILLGLENPTVQRNLIHKVNDDMDVGSNFINSYFSSFLKDQMMTNVVEESSQGIVLFDKNNLIHYINEEAYRIFHVVSGDHFDPSLFLPENLLEAEEFKYEVVAYDNENYLVEKESVKLLDENIGCFLVLQNEKNVRDTESNLAQRLKARGFYAKYVFGDIIHQSDSMSQCISIAKKVAPSDYTILIRGESGTGKELLSQSIHNYSSRKNNPFVAINCAALPETLLESELFGYEPGAFTGAHKNGKVGLFEQAQKGTIFLDEIGNISPNLQSRLLRVIQERQVMRVGSDHIINIDVRIIAATNVNLEKQVLDGNFRNDLFYRLNVITLNIAPLRERRDDILPLLKVFLGKIYQNITPGESRILLNYNWPGNVRELENVASYYKILNEIPAYINSKENQLLANYNDSGSPDLVKHSLSLSDSDIKLSVLQIISKRSSSASGIGRRAIMASLTSYDIFIGEGTLKRIMSELKDDGLITVSQGRSGSSITEEGIILLKNSSNTKNTEDGFQ